VRPNPLYVEHDAAQTPLFMKISDYKEARLKISGDISHKAVVQIFPIILSKQEVEQLKTAFTASDIVRYIGHVLQYIVVPILI
jgi:hypothetical protein